MSQLTPSYPNVRNYPAMAGGSPSRATPERKLWIAVLLQQVQDALILIPDEPKVIVSDTHMFHHRQRVRTMLNAKTDAQRWLVYGGENMRTVCELAGFDPDAVQAWVADANAKEWNVSPPKLGEVLADEAERIKAREAKADLRLGWLV